jgi:hypothetical protein
MPLLMIHAEKSEVGLREGRPYGYRGFATASRALRDLAIP